MPKARLWSDEECDWLKENISYDPETGTLTWIKGFSNFVSKGEEVGSLLNSGYRHFSRRVDGKRLSYSSHRVGWFISYGVFPKTLDHINNIPSDNRLENLREATLSQNGGNSSIRKDNTSGAKGVFLRGGRYLAHIYFKGSDKHLGTFETLEEAAIAYDEAAIEQWGEYAYTNKDHGVY